MAPATVTIEIGDYLETKIDAFRAHASQQPLWALFEEYERKGQGQERFHLAAAVKWGPDKLEDDLFASVNEEVS